MDLLDGLILVGLLAWLRGVLALLLLGAGAAVVWLVWRLVEGTEGDV